MFPKAKIEQLMKKYVLVRMYTDRRDSVNLSNRKMENDKFGTIAMPFYVIVNSNNETISTFPGLTREEDDFAKFLSKGLQ